MSPAEQLLAVQLRCRHPRMNRRTDSDGVVTCGACLQVLDAVMVKRGRNNRKRGNSHELSVARKYGGEKVGQLGLPEDIRSTEYRTQVKTHQRPAPGEWRKAFAALEAVSDNRTPRLIVRFLSPGLPADDYIIIRGSAWLDRFGTDEEEPAA